MSKPDWKDAEAEALFNGKREFKRLDWTRGERK